MLDAKVAVNLDAFPAIRTLFARVIDARLSSKQPHSSFIERLKSGRKLGVEFWEERCAGYLSAVVDKEKAIEKATTELLGNAARDSPEAFDLRLDDYFLEICVIHDLALRGCSSFEPLVAGRGPKSPKSPDYRFVITDERGTKGMAFLEVKNLRAPVGINVMFPRLLRELSVANPFLKRLGMVVSHYCDNRISEIQISEMREFLLSLAGLTPPASRILTLDGNIEIGIQLTTRPGLAFIRRFFVGDSLGPFTEQDRLLNKATDAIQKAINQLEQCPAAAIRVVAINIESPDSVVSSDTCIELCDVVRRLSQASVEPVIFHRHSFLDCSEIDGQRKLDLRRRRWLSTSEPSPEAIEELAEIRSRIAELP